jgi:phage tail-like protein
VVRLVGDGIELLPRARADLVESFPHSPIHVDPRGHLHLHCAAGPQVFDLRGRPVAPEGRLSGERYERLGRYLSTALDSAIDGCQWHRVELRGAIPLGSRVEVRTTTAAIELTPAEIDSLPASAWSTRITATAMAPRERATPADCAWDCLILSPPGRYLWIELAFAGDGRVTPSVSDVLVEYPRISLRRYLPAVFGFDPMGADFADRFTAIFDATLRSIEGRIDRAATLFDPFSAPAEAAPGSIDFLSWLAGWIGVTLSRDWPVSRRRHYLKQAARLYSQRGTPDGLRRQLYLFLGFDRAYGERCLAERPKARCVPLPANCGPCPPRVPAPQPPLILEHFKLRRWLYAGQARLGSDSVLWGKRIVDRSELSGDDQPPAGNAQVGVTRLDSVLDPLRDPFHVAAHKFSVFVPARIRDTPGERRALEQLLAHEAPAHTQVDVRYVEPRFRVGVQAMIGLDSVIARSPCGVKLDEAVLRHGTVLSGERSSGPQLEVGDSRVGTTTRLT